MFPGPLNGTIVYFPTGMVHLGSLEGKCAMMYLLLDPPVSQLISFSWWSQLVVYSSFTMQ